MVFRVDFKGFYLLEADDAEMAAKIVGDQDEMGYNVQVTSFSRPKEATKEDRAKFELWFGNEEKEDENE